MFYRLLAIALFLPAALWAQTPTEGERCAVLARLQLPATSVVSAALAPAAPFPGNPSAPPVPAHCVVKAVARPTSDSQIQLEVWLPAAGWNGRYQQVGNGGWAGSIPSQTLALAVQRGYAAAGTDDGHSGGGAGDAAWAIGHPEKLIDFGYRSLHETAVRAKALITAFYGRDPERNYFFGCSDGGREALMAAQRFPEDFDGILAGAPASDWSHLFTAFVWNEQALLETPASAIPPAKLPAVQKAVLAACDALDGVKDGLLEDPRACRFDPGVLTCQAADGADCLTAPQVAALRKIYAGPTNPRTGERIHPGFSPGVEAVPFTWGGWIIAPMPEAAVQFAFGNSFFGHAVFEDPQWNFRKLNFDSDVAFADAKAGPVLNSSSPDLRTFRAHGGKLIQYHGWGDGAVAPQGSIDYYERVRAFLTRFPDPRSKASGPVQDFYRLFMVPGMGHCGAGLGPNNFGNVGLPVSQDPQHDIVQALEQWVEKGVAPERLIGTGAAADNPAVKLTRPLCPYPQVARYNGSGDSNDSASFSCAVPEARP